MNKRIIGMIIMLLINLLALYLYVDSSFIFSVLSFCLGFILSSILYEFDIDEIKKEFRRQSNETNKDNP